MDWLDKMEKRFEEQKIIEFSDAERLIAVLRSLVEVARVTIQRHTPDIDSDAWYYNCTVCWSHWYEDQEEWHEEFCVYAAALSSSDVKDLLN